MALLEDLRAELVTINQTTDELAQDVDDLIAKVGSGETLTQADVDALRSVSTRLRGTADKYTPEV